MGLLEWQVQNISTEAMAKSDSQGETREKRLALVMAIPRFCVKPCTIYDKLSAGKSVPRKWFILEGNSYPDAFLETDTFILVVEGKRTEIP